MQTKDIAELDDILSCKKNDVSSKRVYEKMLMTDGRNDPRMRACCIRQLKRLEEEEEEEKE